MAEKNIKDKKPYLSVLVDHKTITDFLSAYDKLTLHAEVNQIKKPSQGDLLIKIIAAGLSAGDPSKFFK